MLVGRDLGLPNLVVLVVVFVIFPVICFVIRRKWLHAAARREEIQRLLVLASEEAARAEIEATEGYYYTANTTSVSSPDSAWVPAPDSAWVPAPDSAWVPATASVPVVSSVKPPFQCAVCFSPTSTRCAKCKAVRYCSGRCQIVHWRQGHKDECRPYVAVKPIIKEDQHSNVKLPDEIGSNFESTSESSSEKTSTFSTPSRSESSSESSLVSPARKSASSVKINHNKSDLNDEDIQPRSTSSSRVDDVSSGFWSGAIHSKKPIINELDGSNEVANENMTKETNSSVTVTSTTSDNSASNGPGIKKSNDMLINGLKSTRPPKYASEMLKHKDATKISTSINDSKAFGDMSSAIPEKSSHLVNNKNITSAVFTSKVYDTHLTSSQCTKPVLVHEEKNRVASSSSKLTESSGSGGNGLKSMLKVVDQVKPFKLTRHCSQRAESETAHKYSCKGLFSYEMFVKLYNWKQVELRPFGLINCGNSCYANAVLQCLTYTPPLNAYLLQGLHSKACDKREWCFTCEFEGLVLKAKNGNSPLSPIRILSQIGNIGSNLGHGKQEDAHEFLRYAIDALQSVCLKEAGKNPSNSLEEETTLIGVTFGGYLRSKIKCMKCGGKSERHERMMDLTVEIEGNIGSLEEALDKFTCTEILDGENKYKCSRCKSYEKAKKKLTLLEAPNVLTIALKRFQSGKFGKLNKSIHFPEFLDMAPYVSGTSDKSPVYRLYGVVVHIDIDNAAFSGHYVCYVKNIDNRWFKIDDSWVKEVDVESVLTKGAYMLLYARCSPRAPRLIRSLLLRHQDSKKHKAAATSSSFTSRSPWDVANRDHLAIRNRSLEEESSSSSDGSGMFSESCSCSTERDSDHVSWDWEHDYNSSSSLRNMNSSDSDTSSSSSSSYPSPLYTRNSHNTLRERSRSCKVGPGVLYLDDDQCRKLSCSNSCREGRLSGGRLKNPNLMSHEMK